MNPLDTIKQRVRLEEGRPVLEKMLIDILLQPGISTKTLARANFLPVPVVAAIKKELKKSGLASKRYGISLTAEGRQWLDSECGFAGIDTDAYARLLGGSLDVDAEFPEEVALLESLFAERPRVDVTLDQSKCTPQTSLRRALLGLRNHALIGKRILCVGDDDLVSVALGLLATRLYGPHEPRSRMHVLDIDERFLDYIAAIAARHGLPIRCQRADIRAPLPADARHRFDAVFTDPPYTLAGARLFVSRGIEALKPEEGLPIFLSFAHKPPEFELQMQRDLLRMGLVMSEILPAFNQYEGAEMIGNIGQMTVLRTTRHAAPVLVGAFDDPLYTGEVKPTTRIYACKGCRALIEVGAQAEYITIEALKDAGCPECGTSTFELKERRTEIPATSASSASSALSGDAMKIRPIRESDIPIVARFEQEIAMISFGEEAIDDHEFHVRKLTKALPKEGKGMLVLEARNTVVGWLWMAAKTNYLSKEKYVFFKSLYLEEPFRGTAYAKALMDAGMAFCRKQGAKKITGKVHVRNLAMQIMYKNYGFQPTHLTMEYTVEE